jgi:RNA polymerase sigma factor (sigma-70 family)
MDKFDEQLLEIHRLDTHLKKCVQTIAQHLLSKNTANSVSRTSAELAFSELYDATVHRVFCLVRRFIRDEDRAQEITADVFHQAWLQAGRFDAHRGNVVAWLLIMARSKPLDACRQQAAQRVTFDSEITEAALAEISHHETPLDILLSVDRNTSLYIALEKVAPLARQMIGLAFYKGLTHSEISEHMNMPLGTVKTVIRRSLRDLRKDLKELVGVNVGCIDLLAVDLDIEESALEKSEFQHE